MKLLGWTHRKLRHINNTDTFREFSIGHSSLDDQPFYPRHYGTNNPIKQGLHRDYNSLPQKSFSGFEPDFDQHSSSATISQLFHSFLSIGTLGANTRISVENDTQVTENELKVISDELERVLGNESVEDAYNNISRRNSHASPGTTSHGSIITLSGGKTIEATTTDTSGNGSTTCPLQVYLFGSGIEMPQTTTTSKKEYRTSLGELFQKDKLQADDNYGGAKKRMEKEGDTSAVQAMKKLLKKKMLKKKMLRASKSSAGGTADSDDSVETKLILHKKNHPESLGAASIKNPTKADQNAATKRNIIPGDDHIFQDNDIIIIPQRPASNPTEQTYKDISEHWIKTDDDYIVLELQGKSDPTQIVRSILQNEIN